MEAGYRIGGNPKVHRRGTAPDRTQCGRPIRPRGFQIVPASPRQLLCHKCYSEYFTPKRPKKMTAAVLMEWDSQNREAARIILRDRERYAGLPVEWAEMIIKKTERPWTYRPRGST